MKFNFPNYSIPTLLLLLFCGGTLSCFLWHFLSGATSLESAHIKKKPPEKNSIHQNIKTVPVSTTLPKRFSVKDLGALGNGIADDTQAIQATIDRVYKRGGGIVFFPKGTYIVKINPSKAQALIIRTKIIFQGENNRNTIIKLADKQGNYDSILAGAIYHSDLSDFAMYDLAIDGNSSQNPVFLSSDFSGGKFRFAVRIFWGRRIHIERCRFTNQNNVNTITVNGEESVSDVLIKDNIFESIGGGKIDYDHSTIYSHGKRVQILNNTFDSRDGAGTYGARTAIEIHGDEHIVKQNVIEGFIYGINITGIAQSSNHQIITDNLIKNAHTGMVIWSYFGYGNTTNPALSNCMITNNKIILNINDWRQLWGDYPNIGISLQPNSDAPISNLNIIRNQITFTNFYGTGRRSDSLGNGITLWRNAAPNIEIAKLRIIGNKIENSLAAGIYISTPIKSGDISENLIINSGQVQDYFHEDYRAAIILNGMFENIKINKNLMRDDRIHNTMTGGIYWFGDCVANCQAKGNILQMKSSVKLEVFQTKSSRANSFDVSP
ncbi:glycosyl hydrolase family 28-related protein [Microcoleus sp. S13C4]|uniref:glycosyl hydrolase family 28-related protein n=1 Tax=Microcoleus sp. S13C4 TaxID=3055410 RepID=UPI002FD45E4C